MEARRASPRRYLSATHRTPKLLRIARPGGWADNPRPRSLAIRALGRDLHGTGVCQRARLEFQKDVGLGECDRHEGGCEWATTER